MLNESHHHPYDTTNKKENPHMYVFKMLLIMPRKQKEQDRKKGEMYNKNKAMRERLSR